MNKNEYSESAAAVKGTELREILGSVPLLFCHCCRSGPHVDLFDQELTQEIHLLCSLIEAIYHDDMDAVNALLMSDNHDEGPHH